jgi:hypothetical protein
MDEKKLREAFDKTPFFDGDDYWISVYNKLENLRESIIEIITHSIKRMNRLSLLRHEIHQPNDTVRLNLSNLIINLQQTKQG